MVKKIEEEENYDDEITELDLIYELSDRLDALIEVLIDKKMINEKEFNKKLDEIINENNQE